MMFTAQLMIGPALFIPLRPSRGAILCAMSVGGVAYGFNVVSSFARSHKAARRLGHVDDLDTFVMLSGT